jgi:hypothetical protein
MFLHRNIVVKQATVEAEAITRPITQYALNFSSSFEYPFTSLDITFVLSRVHTMTIYLFLYHQAIWGQSPKCPSYRAGSSSCCKILFLCCFEVLIPGH